jgi:hypothetical protein
MPEPITLSVIAVSALTALAGDFLKGVAKKSARGLKELFKGDETRAVLNDAFQEFKAYCFNENSSTEEKILLQVFAEFFTDDRTIREFQLVFAGQSHQVDFNLMEEIFVAICIENKIEIPKFEFFRALSHVIKSIETIAQKEETFKKAVQASKLEGLYNALQKRDQEVNLTFARFKYLHQLSRHNNRLQFTGIPDPKEKKDIELPEVFVMQRARESVPGEDYQQLLREHEGDKAFSDEEVHLRRIMPVHREETRPAMKFNRVLEESDNRRFVVLGKPGSGKSSLLKFLMLTAAQKHLDFHRDSRELLFPIFVEIRKLEHALAGSTEPDYNILEFLYDSMSREYGLRLPGGGFFESYLDKGKALLLFDGLDEVAAESRRAEIRRMISAFITSRHPGNTVIVTSRIAGYSRARFSTTDYHHFTLEDFNQEEIEAFIHRWYHSRLSNPAEADSKAEDLKEALKKKPPIRELAKNPLLLTIIGIIHRYEAQLPEDRLVLYDKAAEALLYTWDNVKKIIDEKFKLSHRQRFLGKVAFHLQSIEKGDEAGTMMDRHELYGILLEDFRKVFGCENWEAKGLVDEFLETIKLRAGLLVELAPDKFGFAHKTFQEYFAARWIANEAILKFNLQIMKDHINNFIDDAFWHETLLLALRALPCQQAIHVLEHILERDPRGIETYFYHSHYFVMKFIAEQGQWLDNKEFVEKQVDGFFNFSWNEGEDRGYYNNYTWKRFNDWLSSVSDSPAGVYLYKKLLSAAEDQTQDVDLRRSCASALGQLGHKDKAVEILLGLAEDQTQDVDLRRDCASALGQLGHKDKAVVERLLGLAEDQTQDVSLRRSCASALGQLGHKDKAVEILLGLAEDQTQSVYLRRSCASALGQLGHKKKAVDILVDLYLAQPDKTEDDSRLIYDSLWELTVV